MNPPIPHNHITVSRLKRRLGWTEHLIRRHLGSEDIRTHNPYNPASPPMRLFLINRVQAATERDSALQQRLVQNQDNRRTRDVRRETEQNLSEPELIAVAQGMEVQIIDLTTTDAPTLIRRSLTLRQRYISDTYGVSPSRQLPEDSPEAKQQAVHMIRHDHTNYDQLLLDMPSVGRPDTNRKIYETVRRSVLSHISLTVPALADTCRQMMEVPEQPRSSSATPQGGRPMTPDKLIALDLETIKPFPPGEQWQDHRPLGIACAATAARQGSTSWYAQQPNGNPDERMNADDASRLVDFLMDAHRGQNTIVTWNGMGFDWQVLAEESGRTEDCRTLALHHVDMMYHLFAIKGFPLSLAAAAAGMKVGTKTEGISGVNAPEMWAAGQRQEVIDYCIQDASLTLDIAIACQSQRGLDWIARSGRPNRLPLPSGWLTVADAARLPLPNTDWMDNPISRSTFDSWLADQP